MELECKTKSTASLERIRLGEKTPRGNVMQRPFASSTANHETSQLNCWSGAFGFDTLIRFTDSDILPPSTETTKKETAYDLICSDPDSVKLVEHKNRNSAIIATTPGKCNTDWLQFPTPTHILPNLWYNPCLVKSFKGEEIKLNFNKNLSSLFQKFNRDYDILSGVVRRKQELEKTNTELQKEIDDLKNLVIKLAKENRQPQILQLFLPPGNYGYDGNNPAFRGNGENQKTDGNQNSQSNTEDSANKSDDGGIKQTIFETFTSMLAEFCSSFARNFIRSLAGTNN